LARRRRADGKSWEKTMSSAGCGEGGDQAQHAHLRPETN
jgi:hypothetical protein